MCTYTQFSLLCKRKLFLLILLQFKIIVLVNANVLFSVRAFHKVISFGLQNYVLLVNDCALFSVRAVKKNYLNICFNFFIKLSQDKMLRDYQLRFVNKQNIAMQFLRNRRSQSKH